MKKYINMLVIEKDTDISTRLKNIFPHSDLSIVREPNIDKVSETVEHTPYEIIICTGQAIRSGDINDADFLEIVSTLRPGIQIFFLLEQRNIHMAASTMKSRNYEYSKLPVKDNELTLLVETAISNIRRIGKQAASKSHSHKHRFEKLIGSSSVMRAIYRQIRQAAVSDIPVLITGDTGTGKDLAAQAIHAQGQRNGKPFIPVHLGALPPHLVSSELFGHEKGAFTGALERRIGSFERADTGTVFLDEISSIDESVQISLLRLLENKSFYRIGGKQTVKSDVRIIAASNLDLSEAVAMGSFREDLLFRLDVFHINMPPISSHPEDIPLLIDEFIKRYNAEFRKNIVGISPECISRLENHSWPGNVRELKNVIQRAVLVCGGDVLLPANLPSRFQRNPVKRPKITFEVGTPLEDIEKEMLLQTLKSAATKTEAARLLGISRRALYNKMAKHGLEQKPH